MDGPQNPNTGSHPVKVLSIEVGARRPLGVGAGGLTLLVSVAAARELEKASPLSGTWEGPPNAFDRMEVSVQVVPL